MENEILRNDRESVSTIQTRISTFRSKHIFSKLVSPPWILSHYIPSIGPETSFIHQYSVQSP